ncbi:hypothetical protein CPLU01_09965 [Colletotrichum plurivorum]|uniref:Uncharacterized protein n=1 Tax=Colletotrichum plurivorum TaxID=2175906 RepID=A0A8H6K756_9PEZI|nr:hypothetical protein CPLU01_09965 [Colletotrichum plurivorum]
MELATEPDSGNDLISASGKRSRGGVKFVGLQKGRKRVLINRAKRFSSPNLQNQKEPDEKEPDDKDSDEEGTSGTVPTSSPNLPSFGSLEPYGVSPEIQQKLWTLEIERLAEIVDDDKADMLMPKVDPGSEASLLSQINKEAFTDMRLRADNILDALHVCIIDDQALLQTERASEKAVISYRALKRAWNDNRAADADLPGHQYTSTKEQDPSGRGQDPSVLGPYSSIPAQDPNVASRLRPPYVLSARSATDHYLADDNTSAIGVTNATELGSLETTDQRSEDNGSAFVQIELAELDPAETMDQRSEANESVSVQMDIAELIETQRLSCYLVDHIAATLAILACRGRNSKYWHAVVLACLAKLSTKLKVLLSNLSDNIQILFSHSEDVSQRVESWSPRPDAEFDEDEGEEEPLDANSPTKTRYCAEHDKISSWLAESFTHALRGLGAEKPWWNRSSHVDVCAMIYAAGVSGTRTLVCQDRRGEISGSSASLPVSFSSKALGLVGQLSDLLGKEPRTSIPSDIMLEVELDQSDIKSIVPNVKSLGIHTVSDFVVVATTLSLSHPRIGKRFQDSLHIISALPVFGTPQDIDDKPSKDVTPAPKYAFVRLGPRRTGDLTMAFSSLSSSHLAATRHIVLDRQPPRADQLRHPPSSSEIVTALKKAEADRKYLQAEIKCWDIAEASITIRCPKYVYSVFLFSAILVIGGLCCGFLVGERVAGVDPFNFTMFSWIIGGFVLLIAKSVRVSDWPWRDFLLRQVTCRTVREVANVSGLEPQDILTFLLANEHHSKLKLRGPFQEMFYNEGDSEGFSIDVRPSFQTLLAS